MKKIISIVLIFMTIFLNGCAMTNKIGWTNSDFDYIKDGMVTEIKIQNTRDKGYTFVFLPIIVPGFKIALAPISA